MANKKLKLYVWTGVLTDYTDGVIFALAHDPEEARRIVRQQAEANKQPWAIPSLNAAMGMTPDEYDTPFAFYLYGGS